ncbi:MAG: hypothetical protein FWD46_03410 [Cystobacterineae bacterium]|nr:hypothetical protein [Cystobacterineae bacterium]
MGFGLSSFGMLVGMGLWLGVSPGNYSEAWLCDLWAGARCHTARCEADMAACEAAVQHCASASQQRVVSEEEAKPIAECARWLLLSACETPPPKACQPYMLEPQP